MRRTRIKVCGFTRETDLSAAIDMGIDAVGFVFYPASPRHVSLDQAARLARCVPPFISRVALFVNPQPDAVEDVLRRVPIDCLQFHGDEPENFCAAFGRAYLKAVRVRDGVNLVEYANSYTSAQGLLLDAYSDGWGGSGRSFDWSLIPAQLPLPLVLSGGLGPANVADAVRRVRPQAVDVSSGVELAKGIKDPALIAAFIAGVENGETRLAG